MVMPNKNFCLSCLSTPPALVLESTCKKKYWGIEKLAVEFELILVSDIAIISGLKFIRLINFSTFFFF